MEYFVIATGQDDNIGDAALRRRMLVPLQSAGKCHVYVGSNSADYIKALNIGSDHVIYSNFAHWLMSCTWKALAHGVNLVHNAGELGLNKYELARHISLIPASVLARLRRKRVTRVGLGIRGTKGVWWPVYRLLTTLDTATIWRDPETYQFFGRGIVRPDWAFDDRWLYSLPESDAPRRFLTVSMRFDRPMPSAAWIQAIRQVAYDRGLEILIVSQVRRDNDFGRQLATKLEAPMTPWTDATHIEQERIVRDIYRQSEMVVSDRLHALIIGLSEGALPIGAVNHEDIKIGRHFEAAGIPSVSFDARELSADEMVRRIQSILERRSEILDTAREAAQAIADCDSALVGEKSLSSTTTPRYARRFTAPRL